MMLVEKPSICPLCNSEWISNLSNDRFTCINYKSCRLTLITWGQTFHLKKTLVDGTEVWWGNTRDCEIKFPNKGLSKIAFMLPYSLTPQRLRTLLLFS
jgi:hypothetical protein